MEFRGFYLFILLLFIVLSAVSQTSETYNGHVINRTDEYGVKKGKWLFFNSDRDKIVEQGEYFEDQKEGKWIKYYPNGNVKQELTYVNNKPDGYAKTYYEDGTIAEEGIWKNNKWVGDYKYYFTNGNVAYQWSYNKSGKREGVQKYFHENGKLMIEGDWANGKESGVIKEFNEKGILIKERNYIDGKLNNEVIKTTVGENTIDTIRIKPIDNDTSRIDTIKIKPRDPNQKLELFTGNGYSKLYNKFNKIEQDGYFVNGILRDGKKYYYNSEGVLIKTAIVKNGKVTGIEYEEN